MDFKNAVDQIVLQTQSVAQKVVDEAGFDKSYMGVIRSKTASSTGNMYTYGISVQGALHTVKSEFEFDIDDYALVLVPKNNWASAKLIITSVAQLENTIRSMISGAVIEISGDHRDLTYRDAANQHPMSAISGLSAELDEKVNVDDAMTNTDVQNLINDNTN